MTLILPTLAMLTVVAQGKYVVPATLSPSQSLTILNDNNPVANCLAWYGAQTGDIPTVVADTGIDGYEAYILGQNNPSADGQSGAVASIVPQIDGTVTIAVNLGPGKEFYIKESENGSDFTSLEGFDGLTVSSRYKGTFTFPVKAGFTYRIYASGSKLGFYGFELHKKLNCLWLERTNGEKVGYLFADEPKLTCKGSVIVVKSGDAQTEFDVSDVNRIYFDSDVTATATEVRDAVFDGRGELIRVVAGGASLQGFAAGTTVAVYDAGGRVVNHLRTDASGQATVSLAGLPHGVYIIKAGRNVLKLKH